MERDDALREAAAGWLMREIDGLDAEGLAQRNAWLASSPTHSAAYDQLRRAWAAAGLLGDSPAIAGLREAALAPRRPRWPRAGLAAAAALALMLTGGTLVWQAWRPAPSQPVALVLQTRPGQQATFTLADRSQVTLDTDSRVTVRLAAHRRDLELDRGQAYFRVAHDRARPFVVRAAEREVVAVGTEFDVMRDEAAITVALSEGRVRIEPVGAASRIGASPVADTAELAVGQTLVFDRAHRQTTITRGDLAAVTGWRQGKLHFDRTPLGEAVARFNRYGNTPIRLADPTLATLPVSGVFDARHGEDFARALPLVFAVDVAVRDGVIVLGPARHD